MIGKKLILWLVTISAAVSPAATAAQHYAISAATLAEVVSRIGVPVSPDQITLPTGVVSTMPSPLLKIRSVVKLDNERLLVRLECVNSDECLPFLVDVRVGLGSEAQIAALDSGSSSSSRATQPGGGAQAVRSGSPVTLVLDGDHVHIRVPAICLQAGAPGQMIHVTDTHHRLVYLAQVVDTSVVKGTLK
jgi:hypothetical protein